jgi:hypothetical protein
MAAAAPHRGRHFKSSPDFPSANPSPLFNVRGEKLFPLSAAKGRFHRNTSFSLGLEVMPGILPRLAMGFPSTSWMSAVKSMGLAPLI